MKLKEARQKFIDSWGTFGTKWGINRTMALVHGLILATDKPVSTEDIMEQLNISRGNANMNIRALIDWGLAHKVFIAGERMEYFEAEKDIYKVALMIIRERRKRELEPIRYMLQDLQKIDDKGKSADNFKKVVKDIDEFAEFADKAMEKMIRNDRTWLLKTLKKVIT